MNLQNEDISGQEYHFGTMKGIGAVGVATFFYFLGGAVFGRG
jgi:hypothetical protein